MVNNYPRALALVALGMTASASCHRPEAEPEMYQGVAELRERRLGFEVAGRILELRAREGDRVPEGAVIATIDASLDEKLRVTRDLEANAAASQAALVAKGARPEELAAMRARIRAARAAEDLLKVQVERERALHERGVTPQAKVDEFAGQHAGALAQREALESGLAELQRGARPEERAIANARADAARASVGLEELRVQRHELHAPADGVVLDVHAEPGEVVGAGVPVLTVADPGRVYADVFVPQGKLSGIDVGDRASVRADGIGANLSGRIEHVSRRTEFTPRYLFSDRERPYLVVRVRVEIADPEQRLPAGVPVFVSIERNSPRPAPGASSSAWRPK